MNREWIIRQLSSVDRYLKTLRPAGQMLLFATFGSSLVAIGALLLGPTLKAHQNQRLITALQGLMREATLETGDLGEAQILTPLSSRQHMILYPIRQQGEVMAWLVDTTTDEGYNGNIRLALLAQPDRSVIGVHVISHRETPGIGDFIERSRSAWIRIFEHRQLDATSTSNWAIRKDGGTFDQRTGATVTSRAMVKAVREALESLPDPK